MHSQIIFILEWNTTKFTCLRIVCVNSSLVTLKVTIAVKNLFAFITKYFVLLSCFSFHSLGLMNVFDMIQKLFTTMRHICTLGTVKYLRPKNLASLEKSDIVRKINNAYLPNSFYSCQPN